MGINFALRGGEEHSNLRRGERSQLSLRESEQGKFLNYTEDTSKANQGGSSTAKYKRNRCKPTRAYNILTGVL